MATENIRIKYDVDKKELDASNKSLKKTAELNDLTQKEVDQTNDKFKDQEKQLSKTNKAFTSLGDQLKSVGNRFQIAGQGAGDMAAGMFSATTATGKTTKAMKLLKVAIASTGIGLLVIALGSLVTFFTKSQKGSDMLSKTMSALGAVVDTVIGRFAAVGEGLALIFDGKWAEGGKVLANSFKGVTAEIVGAVKGSNEYEAMLIKLREREIEVTASVAKRTKIIQEQLLATKNNTLSFVEQKKALDLVEKLQIENEEELLDIAQQRLDLVKKDLENTPEALRMDEQRLEVAEAQATFDQTVANSKARQRDTANRQTELANRILATTKAQAAEEAKLEAAKQAAIDKAEADRLAQAEADAQTLEEKKQAISDLAVFTLESQGMLEEAELERRRRLLENTELIEEERQLIIAQSEANITAIREAETEKAIEATKKLTEVDKIANESKIDGQTKTLDAVAGLLNKESLAGKAAAIAQVGIQTQVAASAALAAPPLGLGPVFGPILAAAVIAKGLISAAKISGINPKFEKGGRIGGNLHAHGGTLIEAERDEFMMSRKATAKYGFDFMEKINNLELNDLTVSGNSANVNIIDTKEIAEQLKNMPQNIMNVDSEGFALHQRRGHSILSQKITRYST